MLRSAKALLGSADLRVGRIEDSLPDGPFDLRGIPGSPSTTSMRPAKPNFSSAFMRHFAPVGGSSSVTSSFLLIRWTRSRHFDPPYDKPSPLVDQLRWLEKARFTACVSWSDRDLVVIQADRAR